MTPYTNEQITELNITLSTEFSLYVLEHPDFAARIPKEARVGFVEFERLKPVRSCLVRPRVVKPASVLRA